MSNDLVLRRREARQSFPYASEFSLRNETKSGTCHDWLTGRPPKILQSVNLEIQLHICSYMTWSSCSGILWLTDEQWSSSLS